MQRLLLPFEGLDDRHGKLLAWLSLTQRTHPHRILGASFDSLTLRFDGELADGPQFLRRVADFCPDLFDGEENEELLAEALADLSGGGDLFLWWD